MTRTLRGKRLRRMLARMFGWRCGICGAELPEHWHADHVEPWTVTGRTNVFEMQPTCPGCNLSKGAKYEGSTMKDKEEVNPSWDDARRGIRDAVITAVERRKGGERSCTLVLPTRYGKTDVARLIACMLHSRGLAPYVVCVSPALVLRKNVANIKKWARAMERYRIPHDVMKPRTIDDIPQPRRTVEERFLSVTTHMLQSQQDAIKDWVNAIERAHGARPTFIFDECQLLGDANEWGTLVRFLMDIGCYVVLMSATPFRHDGSEIPGARYKETAREDYVRPVCVDGSTPEKTRVNIYEGTCSHREMIPDFELTFHEAWQEPELPMCHIGLNRVRVDVKDVTHGEYDTLDQIPETECRRVLGACVRDRRVVEACVGRFVRALSQLKSTVHEAQGIVFAAGRSADDGEDDQHYRMVMKELRKQAPAQWNIVGATQDSDGANDAIIKFCGNQDTSPPTFGIGDALLLKSMGNLGLDAPQCKVVLDLSPMRTLASWVQRVMRGGTRYQNFTTFELITPADVLSSANLSWLTNGGTVGLKIRENEELTDSFEVAKKPPKQRTVWEVEGVEQGSLLDSKGNAAGSQIVRTVSGLFDRIPDLRKVVSMAEMGAALMADATANDVWASADEGSADDISDEIKELSKKATKRVCAIVSREGCGKDVYSKRCAEVMNDAKAVAGCPLEIKTSDYTKGQIDRLNDVLEGMLSARAS